MVTRATLRDRTILRNGAFILETDDAMLYVADCC